MICLSDFDSYKIFSTLSLSDYLQVYPLQIFWIIKSPLEACSKWIVGTVESKVFLSQTKVSTDQFLTTVTGGPLLTSGIFPTNYNTLTSIILRNIIWFISCEFNIPKWQNFNDRQWASELKRSSYRSEYACHSVWRYCISLTYQKKH